MPQLAIPSYEIRPCPIELLVRHEIGSPFDRYVASHDVVRLVPGIYVEAAAWKALAPWDRYLAKVHAVGKKYPDAVFVYESAAALLGIPFVGSPRLVHILADRRGGARTRGILQSHFFTDNITPILIDGVSVTSIVDTAVDIARVSHPALGLATLDQIVRRFEISPGAIAVVNDERTSDRGAANAAWAIERATGIPESVLESLSLAVCEWLGFEAPELQKEFDLGPLGTARVDTYWPGVNVIGEADGESKYQMSAGGVEAALIAEKRREDALRRLSSGFARWGWDDCRDPDRLEQILLAAGVPRVRRRNNAPLRTLAALLRR